MPWDIKNAVLAHYCENDPYALNVNTAFYMHVFNFFCENNSLLYKECFQIRQFNIFFCKVGDYLANMNIMF